MKLATGTVPQVFTVIVIPDDVAFKGLAQLAFDVKTQVTICPVVKVDVV